MSNYESQQPIVTTAENPGNNGEKMIAQLSAVAEKLGAKVDFSNPSSVAEFLVPGEKVDDPSYVSLYDILQYLSGDTRKQILQGRELDTPYLIEKAAASFNNKQKFLAKLDAQHRDDDNPCGLEFFSIYPNSRLTDTIPTELMGAKLGEPQYDEDRGTYWISGIPIYENAKEGNKYTDTFFATEDLFLTDDVSWDLDDCLAYLGKTNVTQ